MSETVLRVEDLSKCYWVRRKRQMRQIWALRNVSLSAAAGEIVGIIGPSGAGKTTLLRVLAGVALPTSGRVVGCGRVVPLLDLASFFQGDLSGRENVLASAALLGIGRELVDERSEEIFEFAGIESFASVPVKRYSAGMVLRLAFSLALHMEPDILLVDDVLAVGDLEFQERALARIEAIAAAGTTVLMVAHDQQIIARLCKRLVWLNAGEVVQEGEPQEVLDAYFSSPWSILGSQAKPPRSGSHISRLGEILSVSMVDAAGSPRGEAIEGEESYFEIHFEVKHPRVTYRCALDFYTHGALAFRSVQPEAQAADGAGKYKAVVRVPGRLFAESIYAVNAGITLERRGKQAPIVLHGAISFPARAGERRGRQQEIAGMAPFPGLVSPLLEWTVERERDVVVS